MSCSSARTPTATSWSTSPRSARSTRGSGPTSTPRRFRTPTHRAVSTCNGQRVEGDALLGPNDVLWLGPPGEAGSVCVQPRFEPWVERLPLPATWADVDGPADEPLVEAATAGVAAPEVDEVAEVIPAEAEVVPEEAEVVRAEAEVVPEAEAVPAEAGIAAEAEADEVVLVEPEPSPRPRPCRRRKTTGRSRSRRPSRPPARRSPSPHRRTSSSSRASSGHGR